jgi:hypothetical protein
MTRDMKVRYCNKHSEPVFMLSCNVFDDITIGYYCVFCFDFVPVNNPELDLLKKLVVNKAESTRRFLQICKS